MWPLPCSAATVTSTSTYCTLTDRGPVNCVNHVHYVDYVGCINNGDHANHGNYACCVSPTCLLTSMMRWYSAEAAVTEHSSLAIWGEQRVWALNRVRVREPNARHHQLARQGWGV